MEIWKNIPGFNQYEASNLGNIKNIKKDFILKKSILNSGYEVVGLNGKNKTVHRLIMLTFVGKNKLDVNHKNGVKTDNRLDNLEYCTKSENIKHRFNVLGHKGSHLGKFGKDNHKSKKIRQIKDGKTIKIWNSIMDIYRELGYSHISEVCRGKRSHEGGFKWKYY